MVNDATDLFAQVNSPADQGNMTDLEKKHMPVIEAPDSVAVGESFEVTVEVGKLLSHPNAHDHHIESVELYEDDVFLCRTDLSAVKTNARVSFHVALNKSGVLRAYESCNMHGVWESSRQIKVNGQGEKHDRRHGESSRRTE